MIAILPRIAAAVVLVAAAAPLSAQKTRTVPDKGTPLGALDSARSALQSVGAPAALSRIQLASRLKKLDGSLPDALPAGAAVVLTPGRLQAGRTALGIYGAELVAPDARGAPAAVFQENSNGQGFYIEFDADGVSIYSIDVFTSSDPKWVRSQSFDVSAWGTNLRTGTVMTPASDGHLVYAIHVPGAGRYTINVKRQPGSGGRWHFYRVDLLRVR